MTRPGMAKTIQFKASDIEQQSRQLRRPGQSARTLW